VSGVAVVAAAPGSGVLAAGDATPSVVAEPAGDVPSSRTVAVSTPDGSPSGVSGRSDGNDVGGDRRISLAPVPARSAAAAARAFTKTTAPPATASTTTTSTITTAIRHPDGAL